MTETAVWVYAVTRSHEQAPNLTGVSGEPVRLVRRGGLVAAVGSVRLDEYGEQALRRNLENLAWLDTRARLHHQVISSLVEAGPVVPMRLAIMYESDERVQQMLAEGEHEIEDALAAVSGRSEWGVKVFAAEEGGADPQPDLAPASDMESGKRGTAYLQRKRAGLVARDKARRSHAATAETVYDAARRCSIAGRRHGLQDRQLSGESREMLLNAAFLVSDERGDEFAETMASLDATVDGIDIQLTGPWPPYSFTFAAGSSS